MADTERTSVVVIDLDRLDPLGRFRLAFLVLRFFLLVVLGIFLAALVMLVVEEPIRRSLPALRPDGQDGVIGVAFLTVACSTALALLWLLQQSKRGYGRARYWTRVAAYGRRYDAIRHDVWARFGGAPRHVHRRRAQAAAFRRRALMVGSIPTAIVLPTVIFLLYAMRSPSLRDVVERYLDVAVIGFTVLTAPLIIWAPYAARSLRRKARGIDQEIAEERLHGDPRPPVLYLRSFGDDVREIVSMRRFDEGIGRDLDRLGFEEALSLPLARVGPLVAVGEPGQYVPSIGAAKAYFDDDAWQAGVLELIRRAGLVTVVLGPTDGVRWEVEQIVRLRLLDRALFFLPPEHRPPYPRLPSKRRRVARAREQSRRSAQLLDVLARHPANRSLKALDWGRILLVHLASDGKFVAMSSRRGWEIDIEVALTLALYGVFLADPGIEAPGAPK